jgi:hypothetical protein
MSQRLLIPTLVLALAGLAGWALAQTGGRADQRKGTAPVDGFSVWVPAKRLDTEQQVQRWMKAERERSEQSDALQRELLNKLNKLESGKKSEPK